MYTQLTALLNHVFPVTKKDELLLAKFFTLKKFKKGEIIVREGDICDKLIFINSGYFRVYIPEIKEYKTVHLAGPNDFVCAFSSFISQSPSFEFVEATTKAVGLVTTKKKLEKLYATSEKWERAGRIIVENLFIKKEMRVISFIRHSSEKRYEELMEKDPEIINNVAQRYIASYLGIKPETLSRIRKKYTEACS